MGLDPQVTAYLDRVRALGLPAANEVPVPAARRSYDDSAAGLFGPTDAVASVEDVDADGVPVRIYRPLDPAGPAGPAGVGDRAGSGPDGAAADGGAAVLYLHGGGWVLGGPLSHDPLCRALCARSRVTLAAADYRLAPEHPYPAAIEDAWTVLRWAADRFSALAVAGDSAGGQLAASVALRARDASVPLRLQALVYPATDHDATAEQRTAPVPGSPLTAELMGWFWRQYVTDPARSDEPDLSPLRARELSGVAPALVITAEYDPLMVEGEAYAARLRSAGVPVRLHRYEGLIHGFIRMPGVIERAREAIDEVASALRMSFVAGG